MTPPKMQLQLHYTKYTTPQLQLHYTTTTTTTTAALHHATSSRCGWGDRPGDHCNHCSHSKKHSSNHLLVHQWIRSAIRDSQQPISPIGFLFLKLPPPPCAVLLIYIYIYLHVYIIYFILCQFIIMHTHIYFTVVHSRNPARLLRLEFHLAIFKGQNKLSASNPSANQKSSNYRWNICESICESTY